MITPKNSYILKLILEIPNIKACGPLNHRHFKKDDNDNDNCFQTTVNEDSIMSLSYISLVLLYKIIIILFFFIFRYIKLYLWELQMKKFNI